MQLLKVKSENEGKAYIFEPCVVFEKKPINLVHTNLQTNKIKRRK